MVQAMLLAAGLGTRLWPLTADRGKPAVPFLGKPLIYGLVELLAGHGIRRAVVNTHHQPESIHRALTGAEASGVELAFSHEAEILGTAGALAKALGSGLLAGDRPTLVVNAKLFTDIDLGAVLEAHRRSGAAVTMVLKPNPSREHFREVLAEGDRVTGFGEGRIPKGPAPLLFTGIHVLEPEVLRSIPEAFGDTVADVYPPLIAAGAVGAFVDRGGRWWELSTLERYLELHQRAAWEGLGPEVVCSPGAAIAPGAEVRRAVLWEGARVEAGAVVEDAILGAGVTIRAGEEARSCVVVQEAIAGEGPRGERWGGRIRVPLTSGAGP